MDFIEYALWLPLLTVAVFDIRDNRIPNNWVILSLITMVVALALKYNGLTNIPASNLIAFFLMLALGFVLFSMRVMAGGDVKLMAVLALGTGLEHLATFLMATVLCGAVYGLFYLFSYISRSHLTVKDQALKYVREQIVLRRHLATRISNKLRLPFAPAIITGFALYPMWV
ncbi:A24 family peptidase [Vibrio chaetopteri]|uniref:A24 family peptidase n=1 Tax=Vibrio chaetopteri TaxID=3016528 RepID=UPI003AB74A19